MVHTGEDTYLVGCKAVCRDQVPACGNPVKKWAKGWETSIDPEGMTHNQQISNISEEQRGSDLNLQWGLYPHCIFPSNELIYWIDIYIYIY